MGGTNSKKLYRKGTAQGRDSGQWLTESETVWVEETKKEKDDTTNNEALKD